MQAPQDSSIQRAAASRLTDIRLVALVCVSAVLGLYSLPWLLSPLWFVLPLAACLKRFPGRALCAAVLLISAWASLSGQWAMADRLPAAQDGSVRWLTGHVTGLPEISDYRTRFMMQADQAPHTLRLSWYQDAPALAPGDCLQIKVKLSAPHGSANPGGFDYEAWLWREGIAATGYVRDAKPCADTTGWSLDGLRLAALQRIAPYIQDSPMRGIIEALALGERSHITDEQWQTLRATGTTHLVAISGLHVGLVAGLVFLVIRWLALRLPGRWPGRWPAQQIATALAIISALAYAALAGWALPTQRAVVMVAAIMLALSFERQMALSRALAWAALVVLICSPASILAPGFWLSFGAVAWLILLSSRLRGPPWLRAVWLQLGLVAALMPLTLWFFAQASLVSPLVNGLLIPAAGVFVPVVLLGVVGTLVWPATIGPALAWLASLMASAWPALVWCASWPAASFNYQLAGPLAVACLLIAGLWLLAPWPWRIRWLGVIWLLPLLSGQHGPQFGPGEYRLSVLDVGQGLASVIRTQHHTLVFDAGPAYPTGFDAGEMIVVPYLAQVARPRVDLLMISHGDLDHAGGAPAIIAGRDVRARLGADSGRPCHAGQRWRWDGVSFAVLYPRVGPAAQTLSDNERSCVLQISNTAGTTLLTGDIEAPAEQTLVADYGQQLAADVLVVPHHGSATSSSSVFVEQVAPRWAIVSAGWHNRWGFPRPDVVMRLGATGARMLNTATDGAVLVTFPAQGKPITVTRWRDLHQRFWQLSLDDG